MQIDVYVVGQNEAFIVTPKGGRLPLDEVLALGNVHYGWSLDSDAAAPRLDWHALNSDMDARGYGVVAEFDVGGLLAVPHPGLPACYPEFATAA